ncbi:hypothetical protein BD309DRAFT_853676 [Dichomitus squalens]|uniref:Uncharacterized protein n=1 Tax=Dichomitus squalens TaxID=114155 RepID=A0A4Q9MQ76_9APHY|nr:uncharacterized protein DICSQDRAFT_55735 [Dichomitus squalens LYAD-421 SS1]EJF63337.1 hypothetical protein DICSQDRAFT_55735 [Dichomitus squalens LYAD-421 SS1]TBU29930.1 hypothetical protein BD311DRAFT_659918 [Dichomitus squalens]TBU48543.1 hypothetical protein BD309DRAFT_853676 [Dichomitus squalens]TBU53655.1 hypothetical protein BD310DRAFT_829605 [Dichomitus squalens]
MSTWWARACSISSNVGELESRRPRTLNFDPLPAVFALCAQGNHDVTTRYGMVGILTAIFCFPIGLLALLVDKERRCVRCGAHVG